MSENERERIRIVKREVEAGLLQRAGVTGVDIGYKVVGGRKTDKLCIRVYVKQKHDAPEPETIPCEIRGIPTDVIERSFMLHAAADEG